MPVFTGSNNFDDSIIGSDGDDTLLGLSGEDTLRGGRGNDSVNGGIGFDRDVLAGGAGSDTLLGGNGDDFLYGYETNSGENPLGDDAADELRGGAGNDVLRGNWGDDRLFGDANNDNLRGDAGFDTLDGGSGLDAATYRFDEIQLTTGVEFDASRVGTSDRMTLADGRGGIDTLISIEYVALTGSQFSDALTGSRGGDFLDDGDDGPLDNQPGRGHDTLRGGEGNDTLSIGGGNDWVDAGVGDDVFVVDLVNGYGAGNATLIGGAGQDLAEYIFYGQANVGGVVFNAVDLSAVTITTASGTRVDHLSGIQSLWVYGSTFSDEVRGSFGGDYIVTFEGDDTLDGYPGADTMFGGLGNDVYVVDNPGDSVNDDGRIGDPNEVDRVNASISWSIADNGSIENLTLTGTAAINGEGNDLHNIINGNAAANAIDGGRGSDRLKGGEGSDTLTGGLGADVFLFSSTRGTDTVTDFDSGSDTLQFSQSGIRVGDGDLIVDGALTRSSAGGFARSNELVVFTADISGAITSASAALAIGRATSAYSVGDTRLFVVDNGSSSAVYLFTALDANAVVAASELQLIATLAGTAAITTADMIFGP